jgi:uncharacterized protein (TIGR03437 family)
MRSFFLILAMAMPLLAVRLESTRLAPEASVWFEPNHGQVGGRTEWTARAAGAWLFLTSNEVVYALPPEIHFDPKKTRGVPTAKTTNVHMRIVGGRRVKGVAEKALGGYSNYFVGKHENEWFSGVPHFGQVRYPEVYPGIDVVFYATGRNVEYDFIVKPGGDPTAIELAFDAAVRIDETGKLLISAGGKSFRQHRPRVFQGTREIAASYRITERGTVQFDVASFDPLVSLRVDPVLDFATYLGGPGEDNIIALTIAPDGNAVLAGGTQSPASPTLDPFQQPSVVSMAPIILKMSADGRRVIFYSILGRGGWDAARAVSLDSIGRIVVAGSTRSATFPLRNAFQTDFKAFWSNGYVTRLSPDGRSLVHSSYIGGSVDDGLHGIAIDEQQNAYVSGGSDGKDYPLVQPIQAKSGGSYDAVISKVGPDGRLLFSTYWGGPGAESFVDIVLRKDGMLFAATSSNNDGFPLKEPLFREMTPRTGWPSAALVAFDTNANTVRFSTYLADGMAAAPTGVALDSEGNIYVTGWVVDKRLPLKNPLFSETAEASDNGFLISFRADGRDVLWSTVLPALEARSVAIDPTGGIYVSGTASLGFPLKGSFHEFKGGGIRNSDHGIMKIAKGGTSLVYSTFIGGTGNELGPSVAAGPAGSVFFAGQTSSRNYPAKNAYQGETGGSTDGVFGRITDNTIIQAPPFQVTPPSLSIRYVQGDPPAAPLRLTIASLTQSVTIQSDVDWLRPFPTTLAGNGSVQIQPELSRLAPGTYRGVVRIGPVNVDVAATILAAAPLLSAVEPARIAIGTDDTEITLRGTGFTNRTTVRLQTNLWQLTPIRFIDSTTLKLTLPKTYFSAEYNHSITVQNPDSAFSKPVSLTVGRPAPAIAAKGIVSAASHAGDVISPGEILTLFGENFEPGMRVNFDGLLATPLYITPGQLSVVAPTGLTGAREVNVIVEMNFDWRSIPVRIPVWPARPGLFTANSSGKGQAAALNQDGSVNSSANPAVKGSIAVLYGTGGGVENLPTKVFIDGIECEVLYAGQAPGLIAGAWQLNVRIPEFASKGEVVWRAGERESVEGVFVALKEN